LHLPKTSSALVGADLGGFAVSSAGVRRSTLTRLVTDPGIMAIVLLRLAYLTVTNAFAMLRLMPMSDRDKNAEILALRHQITVLEHQLGNDRVRFSPSDRAFLAALLHWLPSGALCRMRLLVRPDTVLRWHRDLVARRHAAASRPKRSGRPRTVRSIRLLVLRLTRENPGWGYRRIHGELLDLGIKVAASTVWEILQEAGIDPAPKRASSTWADFLRSPGRRPVGVRLLRNDHSVRGRGCTCSQSSSTPAAGSGSWVPPNMPPRHG
jgi:transposase